MEQDIKTIAFFDFDGTITTKDSLAEFIKYSVGKKSYYLGLVLQSPMLVAFKLKLMANDRAKSQFLRYYFGKYTKDEFNQKAKDYSLNHLDKIVKKEALKKIEFHKQNSHKVVIVSASMRCWVEPWASREDIDLISTKLRFDDDKFSGEFDGDNCYGKVKEIKIKEMFDLDSYDKIYAYGDSRGDKEMLALADESHYKPFRTI
jgi:HAD superfamily hydrolase (TIGR01490 family)